MVFLMAMGGLLLFIGGAGLVYVGVSNSVMGVTILGGILGLLGFMLLAYAGYANQNRVIDRLRGDR